MTSRNFRRGSLYNQLGIHDHFQERRLIICEEFLDPAVHLFHRRDLLIADAVRLGKFPEIRNGIAQVDHGEAVLICEVLILTDQPKYVIAKNDDLDYVKC